MTGNEIFIKISQGSILFPLVLGILNFKKIAKHYKYLTIFLIAGVIAEIFSFIFKNIFNNNMVVLYIFTPFEYLLFTSVYKLYLGKKRINQLLVISHIVFIVFVLIDLFIYSNINLPNFLSRTYEGITITILCLMFFFNFFKTNEQFEIWKYPMFWISIGGLIYFTLNVFFFMLLLILVLENPNLANASTDLHGIYNILANIAFGIAFLCLKTKQ